MEAGLMKPEDQRPDVLGQRLAAGQADPRGRVAEAEPGHLLDDRVDRQLAARPPGSLRVAEAAAEVAAREADE